VRRDRAWPRFCHQNSRKQPFSPLVFCVLLAVVWVHFSLSQTVKFA
ncbi:uncharacterized protein METZ01_LOCUS378909, partial [marine metagenome]